MKSTKIQTVYDDYDSIEETSKLRLFELLFVLTTAARMRDMFIPHQNTIATVLWMQISLLLAIMAIVVWISLRVESFVMKKSKEATEDEIRLARENYEAFLQVVEKELSVILKKRLTSE